MKTAPSLFKAYREKELFAAFFLALIVAVPLIVIFSSLFRPVSGIWEHLFQHVLGPVTFNTVVLTLSVSAACLGLGVGLAALTTFTDFPGRRFFERALVLPLVMPAYVLAFVYVGTFDFSGPLLSGLRSMGIDTRGFPPIRSVGGVITVMTLAFYPYVYLLARQAFLSQGRSISESARSLGFSSLQTFFRVVLPTARPWIAGGVMLVAMETLADFGTVSIFNYDTFTTAIYKTWYGFFSITGAAQLSSLLLMVVLIVFTFEQYYRRHARYWHSGRKVIPPVPVVLLGSRKWISLLICLGVLTAGFVLPSVQLMVWSAEHFQRDFDSRYFSYFFNTVSASSIAALLGITGGLILTYTERRHSGPGIRFLIRFSTLGYAVPGAVLAVGIFISCAWLDRHVAQVFSRFAGAPQMMFLTQTLIAMQLAYLVRFLTVAHTPIESAMQRLPLSYDETARTLGISGGGILRRIHFPLLKSGLISAGVLVFVEVMKEMPITLMTRPFGWDTLSVRIFEMTSEGEWRRAALPAMALVICGFLPLFFLPKQHPPKSDMVLK